MKKWLLFLLILVLIFRARVDNVLAQDTASVLYIPLIGITSVPSPLALPKGPGNVTYKYAVKNFLQEVALSDVQVVDDKCSPIKYVTGDDNNDSKLDYSETWRYSCTTKLAVTTQNTATATGVANAITATHNAYSTVIVGSKDLPPLVSIINITRVAYPLSLPAEGGKITFTYRVNNPGIAPLSNVVVIDNKCSAMSGRLGDVNGNNLLDTNEVWIYTCTTTLTKTTTNTVTVTAIANDLKASDSYTITVKVATPKLPNTGVMSISLKNIVWGILSGILIVLILFYLLTRNKKK